MGRRVIDTTGHLCYYPIHVLSYHLPSVHSDCHETLFTVLPDSVLSPYSSSSTYILYWLLGTGEWHTCYPHFFFSNFGFPLLYKFFLPYKLSKFPVFLQLIGVLLLVLYGNTESLPSRSTPSCSVVRQWPTDLCSWPGRLTPIETLGFPSSDPGTLVSNFTCLVSHPSLQVPGVDLLVPIVEGSSEVEVVLLPTSDHDEGRNLV